MPAPFSDNSQSDTANAAYNAALEKIARLEFVIAELKRTVDLLTKRSATLQANLDDLDRDHNHDQS